MKTPTILLFQILSIFTALAQNTTGEGDSNPINNTRQGFGRFESFDMSVGFVNPRTRTEGSAYYFEDWDTEGVIYIKDKGRVKIKKVNINLYDSTLEAIYDENSVFTFDSDNLVKIVIDDKVFRPFLVNGKLKIFELFFKDNIAIYRFYSTSYSHGSVNPMVNRKTNKYVKNARYYQYRNDELTKIKLSKKSFAKHFQSELLTKDSILDHITKNKLSLNKETDLLEALEFVNK